MRELIYTKEEFNKLTPKEQEEYLKHEKLNKEADDMRKTGDRMSKCITCNAITRHKWVDDLTQECTKCTTKTQWYYNKHTGEKHMSTRKYRK